jgi:hypothetical protein
MHTYIPFFDCLPVWRKRGTINKFLIEKSWLKLNKFALSRSRMTLSYTKCLRQQQNKLAEKRVVKSGENVNYDVRYVTYDVRYVKLWHEGVLPKVKSLNFKSKAQDGEEERDPLFQAHFALLSIGKSGCTAYRGYWRRFFLGRRVLVFLTFPWQKRLLLFTGCFILVIRARAFLTASSAPTSCWTLSQKTRRSLLQESTSHLKELTGVVLISLADWLTDYAIDDSHSGHLVGQNNRLFSSGKWNLFSCKNISTRR